MSHAELCPWGCIPSVNGFTGQVSCPFHGTRWMSVEEWNERTPDLALAQMRQALLAMKVTLENEWLSWDERRKAMKMIDQTLAAFPADGLFEKMRKILGYIVGNRNITGAEEYVIVSLTPEEWRECDALLSRLGGK